MAACSRTKWYPPPPSLVSIRGPPGTPGTHYLEQNPLPEPPFWADVADAEERLRVALSEVYAYYSRNEPMLANVLRDAPLDP